MPGIKTIVLSIVGVLTVGLTGFGINLAFGRDVMLTVDGQTSTLTLAHGTVAEVLVSQDLHLGQRDHVSPALSTRVSDGLAIDVQYARPVTLTLDGQTGMYWTYATTVGAVIDSLGLAKTSVMMSLPSDTPVPLTGLTLTVGTAYNVSVTAGGKTQPIHSYGTVGDTLTSLDLTWDADDIVTPAPSTALSDKLKITLVKVEHKTVTRDKPIPFETVNSDDPNAPAGEVTVVTDGVKGVEQETIDQLLHDGKVVKETVTATKVTKKPVDKVTTTGTKVIPVVPAVSVNVSPGSAQAIARDMVAARGWDDSQFQCLVALWNRESMWRVTAENPYSGAYGIPQALPGSKMASAGADWRTNPATQIAWGLGYIASRYGNPCGAWASSESRGWY